ncbi:MAG: PaaX family transcriptional regulator C-terminal domain-containing protein [Candidatus Nanopelagicales bacterium]
MTSVPVPEVDLRPQSVLLAFFGDYASDPGAVVASAGVLDLLEPAGVGAHATRATLTRMVRRGLLHRVAEGRQAYFGLTDFGRRTVLDGRQRAQEADVVDRGWDGRWTLVGFSLPEASQRERHLLRSRLSWAGFGMVQGGLWAAPHDVDVVALLDDLDVREHVTAFRGEPLAPTETARMVSEAFDLESLAARYDAFVERWRPVADADVDDPLTARVVLSADWGQVLRDDPRLPLALLPQPWPALAARDLQRALDTRLRRPAETEARHRLDIRTLA